MWRNNMVRMILEDLRHDWWKILLQAIALVVFVLCVSGYATDLVFWLVFEVMA